MFDIEILVSTFVILWAVIDPIGTIPVFLAVTKNYSLEEKKKIAFIASIVAFVILIFFMLVGEVLLGKVGVPLAAFQTSGGIILFIFALNMIFGDSKPEEEIQLVKKTDRETAIFPLAIPSIAGPGAILAIVLQVESSKADFQAQIITGVIMGGVLLINYFLMRLSNKIHLLIGNSGAIVISKVMGLIVASMAANNVLMGIKQFFRIS